MENKDKYRIILIENNSFIGELVAENIDNNTKLYKFDNIPYVDGNDFYDIRKEFPNFKIDVGDCIVNSYFIEKDGEFINEAPC